MFIDMENTLSIPVALLAQGPLRIDGVTYYRHGNKVRACKSQRGPRKVRREGEEESSNRFTEVRKMWRIYRRAIGDLPIWRVMAKETGGNKSDSLFHSQNGGCFRPGMGVWAFPTFCFSVGTLDAPVITGAVREGWSVTLNWENDIDRPKAGNSDRVYVGYFYDTEPRAPQMLSCWGACRGDGTVTVDIPSAGQPDGTRLHLYLFFGNEMSNRFSPSGYVEV